MDAQQFFNSGVQKSFKNDFIGAIEDYTIAIKLSSSITPKTITNKYTEGSANITEQVNVYDINEENTSMYFNRGCAYLAIGKFNDAVQDFSKVLEHTPDDAEVYFKRATANYCLRHDEMAKSDLSTAMKLDSKYTEEMFAAQWPE
jgi:tetratricopeptide (TPR) repeat protein